MIYDYEKEILKTYASDLYIYGEKNRQTFMKFTFTVLLFVTFILFTLNNSIAQTPGMLTFSFVPVTKSPGYQGTRNVLAVWIQTDQGIFVKTKLRYAGFNTSDHLPNWAVNSGGPAGNCLSSACDIADATTGATLLNFSAKTFTWNGEMGPANNGTVVADGDYVVTIEETWNHGSSGTAINSFTFTKGPFIDTQTPANNAYFQNVYLEWQPEQTVGVNKLNPESPAVSVYPNPSNGLLTVAYSKAETIRITNLLGMEVYAEKAENLASGKKSIDLSAFANGIYVIQVSNGKGSVNQKLVLNK